MRVEEEKEAMKWNEIFSDDSTDEQSDSDADYVNQETPKRKRKKLKVDDKVSLSVNVDDLMKA